MKRAVGIGLGVALVGSGFVGKLYWDANYEELRNSERRARQAHSADVAEFLGFLDPVVIERGTGNDGRISAELLSGEVGQAGLREHCFIKYVKAEGDNRITDEHDFSACD